MCTNNGRIPTRTPKHQVCEVQLDGFEVIKRMQIEVFVPRTVPFFVPAFKCANITTKICTNTYFHFWAGTPLKHNISTPVDKDECWGMVKGEKLGNETKLERKDEDIWESENEITPEYKFYGQKCKYVNNFRTQVGTIGTKNGETMNSDLEDMSGCIFSDGSCKRKEETIVWNITKLPHICEYESAGTFFAIITKEYALVEEIQSIFASQKT